MDKILPFFTPKKQRSAEKFIVIGVKTCLRNTFFKMEDERDLVCAKVAPNTLRFQDALKKAILYRDIMFDF